MEVAKHSSHLHNTVQAVYVSMVFGVNTGSVMWSRPEGGMTKVTRFSPAARCLDSWQSVPAVVIEKYPSVQDAPWVPVWAFSAWYCKKREKGEEDGPRLMVDPWI